MSPLLVTKNDDAPPFDEADDTDVVELSGEEIVATEIVPVNLSPGGAPRPATSKHPRTLRMNDAPPPRTARMNEPPLRPSRANDLPPPRTLRMSAMPARQGTTRPGTGARPVLPEIVDEDSFSGRETATYQRVSVDAGSPAAPPAPAPAPPPGVLHKTVMSAAGPMPAPIPPAPQVVSPVMQTVAQQAPPVVARERARPLSGTQMMMPPGPPAGGTPSIPDDGVLPAPFSAPRSELPAVPRRRWVGTTIVGVVVGLVVVLGAFAAPRLWRALRPASTAAPPSTAAEAPATSDVTAPTGEAPASAAPPVAATPSVDASATPSTVPSASAMVAPVAPGGSVCSAERALPPEICAYVDAIRAGQDPPRPALAIFQRFLLERDITRIRGRVLSQRDAGTFAITLSGSFGYCLTSPSALEVGALYLGWAERLPPDETCARFRAVTFPDTIERLFAATDPAERRRLADVLAGELPEQLTAKR